jgi:uncharacterized protein
MPTEMHNPPLRNTFAERRPVVDDALLQGICQRIVARFDPERIILFGSYAYGVPHLYSDVDLLVIMESEEPTVRLMSKMDPVARVPFLPMDLLVMTPAEVADRFSRDDHFIADILNRGRVLYTRAESPKR